MLSERLRKARKAKKLTQEQLAQLVKTKKTTISNYETGYSTPSNEMLRDLADSLEVSTDWLLGLTDDPSPSNKKDKPVNRAFLELPEDTTEEEREFLQAQLDLQLEMFRKLKNKNSKK